MYSPLSVQSIAPRGVDQQDLQRHRGHTNPIYRRASVPAPKISEVGQQEIQRSWAMMSAHAQGNGAIGKDARSLMKDYFVKRIRYDRDAIPSTIRNPLVSWHGVTGFSRRAQQIALDLAQSCFDFGMGTEVGSLFETLRANIRNPASSFVHALRAHYDCHINGDIARVLHGATKDYLAAGGDITQLSLDDAPQFFNLLMATHVPDPEDCDSLRVLLTQSPGYVRERIDDGEPIVWRNPAALLQAAQAPMAGTPVQSSSTLKRTYSASQATPNDEHTQSQGMPRREILPFTRYEGPSADTSSGNASGRSSWPTGVESQGSIVSLLPQYTVLSSMEVPSVSIDVAPGLLSSNSTKWPSAPTDLPPWTAKALPETTVDVVTHATLPGAVQGEEVPSIPTDLDRLLALFDGQNDPFPGLTPDHINGLLSRRNPDVPESRDAATS